MATRLAEQEQWSVRLADTKHSNSGGKAVESAHNPEDPFPSNQLCDDTAHDWAQGRFKVKEERGDSYRLPAVFPSIHIHLNRSGKLG